MAMSGLIAVKAWQRSSEHGRNELERPESTWLFRMLAQSFVGPLVWLLRGACVRRCPGAAIVASLSLAVSIVLPQEAAAEERLRLTTLIAEIKARNPSVVASTQRVEAARLRIRRARALQDPWLESMIEDVPPRLRGGMPMVRIQASQMLPWFGKRDRMAEVAARESDGEAARASTTVLDLLAAGKRTYFQLLLNRDARAINREQRAIVETVVEVALARLRSGTGMHHDVLKMQTETSMQDDALIMLEADRREMTAMLNALLDRPAETVVADPEEAWSPTIPLDRSRLVAMAIEHRPEFREMKAMQETETAMAATARREYYPDLMVGALYNARMGGNDGLGAIVGLSLPIWIGSRQRLDVQAAETRARAVERDRAAMIAMVRAEIERQLSMVDTATRRLALLETEFVPRAQETLDSALAAFSSGTVDALALLDALRVLGTQRLGRIAIRVDREIAFVDLERTTGISIRENTP